MVDHLLAIGDVLYRRTVGKVSRSGPLRAILPMEVVMVSMYVMPVTSSFMMWLELTLEIPGVTTSPNGHGAYGYFKVHLYEFWHPQTSHYSRKAMWWGWQLHKCQCPCWQGGLRWSGSPQWGGWRLYGYHLGELI